MAGGEGVVRGLVIRAAKHSTVFPFKHGYWVKGLGRWNASFKTSVAAIAATIATARTTALVHSCLLFRRMWPAIRWLSSSLGPSKSQGVDFAEEQVRLAKRMVQNVALVRADLSNMPFNNDNFDALCSYYAIIHVPRSEHSKLLRDFYRILKLGGLALLCLGRVTFRMRLVTGMVPRCTGVITTKDDLTLMKESGFDMLWFKTVQNPIDSQASHLFVLGQKSS